MLTEGHLLIGTRPVLWTLLGYVFEAAPMLATLGACLIVRIWVCLTDAPRGFRKRALNLTTTAITLLFAAGWVVLQRPSPFYALLSGSGFGALGSGIILISLKWIRQMDPMAKSVMPSAVKLRTRQIVTAKTTSAIAKGENESGEPQH